MKKYLYCVTPTKSYGQSIADRDLFSLADTGRMLRFSIVGLSKHTIAPIVISCTIWLVGIGALLKLVQLVKAPMGLYMSSEKLVGESGMLLVKSQLLVNVDDVGIIVRTL